MARVVRLIGLIIGGIGLVVWSESPITLAEVGETAQPIEGYYDLTFLDPATRAVITRQEFGKAVILHAHIEDAFHIPADGGSVVFQYCSLKRRPSNDINRVDEAPLEKCETGEASWARLSSVPVDALGNAEYVFCCPRITPIIGFRLTYNGRGTSIDTHTILPENFYWGP